MRGRFFSRRLEKVVNNQPCDRTHTGRTDATSVDTGFNMHAEQLLHAGFCSWICVCSALADSRAFCATMVLLDAKLEIDIRLRPPTLRYRSAGRYIFCH
jgi:hypothetical protein